ncbi:MAG: hypothetical protein IT337_12130 [Thermomicrobiales bacterium]|nr:hypothetical protein [Thermomicrobiales bacterium]
MPANLDFVKLPSMPLRELYADLPAPSSPAAPFHQVMYIREQVATATVEAFAPHLVVVDHAPAGLFRELARSLETLREREPRPTFVVLMRDITFSPDQTREIWQTDGIYPLLDNLYDRILVYGERDLYDPVREYGMSEQAALKTRFCGYLAPVPPRRPPDAIRAALGAEGRPLIAVSVGGGADGGPLLRAYLEGLRDERNRDVVSYVVVGPLLPAADVATVVALSEGLPNLTLVSLDPDYLAVARAADVLVSMGGYNSMTEAAYLGKRAIVAPRVPGSEEQVIRADRFAQRGLVTNLPPDELSAARLWELIRAELDRHQPPSRALSFDGVQAIVNELVDAIAE